MDWQTWVSTFGLILISELGDKTQLAVVSQACKFGKPWPVFLGGSLALTVVTALGAAGGQILGAVVPQTTVRRLASAAFVTMGVLIWWETAKGPADPVCDSLADNDCGVKLRSWDWRAFGATFSLLFLAELGDKTQLAVVGLASKSATPWTTFTGSVLALTAVTGLGVLGGQKLCEWIPQHMLFRLSAVAFVLMGILMGMNIL